MFKGRQMLEGTFQLTQGVVNRLRRIAYFPTNSDGEEAEGSGQNIGQLQNSSPSHPPPKTFQSQIIPSTPRNFQPRLATVPYSSIQPSPNPPTAGPPGLASSMRTSTVPKSRPSPIPPPQS
ncbi:hypothetical protein O181_041523 [Austropuccinia psidii MF-1]|uniref:Uncharacterized protein n=1 Tax=Austropuccinia psidii MF-1 TaxID=1389203 RepID=A0A9Q3DJB6_9BASI|nr:hypothetical protein [Austropuccinia psidii MF-1]